MTFCAVILLLPRVIDVVLMSQAAAFQKSSESLDRNLENVPENKCFKRLLSSVNINDLQPML
jgi:hypothetical protein